MMGGRRAMMGRGGRRTKLLAHFDGAAMPPVDEVGGVYAETIAGQSLTTASPKFGVRCLDNGHNGAYMGGGGGSFVLAQPIPDGATSWCIEAWVKVTSDEPRWTSYGAYGWAFGLSGPDPLAGVMVGALGAPGYAEFRNGAPALFNTTPIVADTWRHWAAYLHGGVMHLAVDGVVTAGTIVSSVSLLEITEVDVGHVRESQDRWPGQIDELRVTSPSPYGSSNFTPPSAPFVLD